MSLEGRQRYMPHQEWAEDSMTSMGATVSGPGVGTKRVLTLRAVLPRPVRHRLCGARLKGRAGRLQASGPAARSAWQPTVKACILDAMRQQRRLSLTSFGSSNGRKVFIADRGNDIKIQKGFCYRR